MREIFEDYLSARGYTANGNRGVAYQYAYWVNRIVTEEDITWLGLVKNIDKIIKDYDRGGIHEDIGAMGNNTPINALKRFKEFLVEHNF